MNYHYFLIPSKRHVSFVQEGKPLKVCLAVWVYKTAALFAPRYIPLIATDGFSSLDLSLDAFLCALFHCWLLPLLFYSKPTNAMFVPVTNFVTEPLWQCVLSHTSLLCPTCSAGMNSLSCFCSRQMFLWTAVATITHHSLYSFMLLLHFWLVAEVGGQCSKALLSLWKPPSATRTASRGHPSNWQFLKSPSVDCSCRCTSLWKYSVLFRVHTRFCVHSYYFLILQTIWHHKTHSRADIFKAWH